MIVLKMCMKSLYFITKKKVHIIKQILLYFTAFSNFQGALNDETITMTVIVF